MLLREEDYSSNEASTLSDHMQYGLDRLRLKNHILLSSATKKTAVGLARIKYDRQSGAQTRNVGSTNTPGPRTSRPEKPDESELQELQIQPGKLRNFQNFVVRETTLQYMLDRWIGRSVGRSALRAARLVGPKTDRSVGRPKSDRSTRR